MKKRDYGRKDILRKIYWDLHERYKPVIYCDKIDALLLAGDNMELYVVKIMTLKELANTKFSKKNTILNKNHKP